jgi:CheY-like chemotaxis protein
MKSIHILLVEDSEGDVLLIKEAFKDARIVNNISTVNNGEKAIRFLEKSSPYEDQHTPELILLDINLPRMNGKEVLKFVKNSDDLKHIPVVVLTTSSADEDILDSYKQHANCFITKPLDVDDFFRTVSKIENFWVQLVKLPPKE